MALYNNQIALANIGDKEMYLLKIEKDKIAMNYFSKDSKPMELLLAEDVLEEFDIAINDKSILLAYQDKKQTLYLNIINKETNKSHKLTGDEFPKVYELNISNNEEVVSIFFLYPVDNMKNIFRIQHNIFMNNRWDSILVDEIEVSNIINPIKPIKKGDSIYLIYYTNHTIKLKIYKQNIGWRDEIRLTDNKEKLYLDMIYYGGGIHLVYSEADDGNYVIRYKMIEDVSFKVKYEHSISLKTNATNPIILKRDRLLWIIWNESSRVYSRYSTDKGRTWSDIIFWEESVKKDIYKIKYVSDDIQGGNIIDSGFISIQPEIEFVGFY